MEHLSLKSAVLRPALTVPAILASLVVVIELAKRSVA